MICDHCRKLLVTEGAAPPHQALFRASRTTKLRFALRKPVRIVRFRCGECATNWLLDVDPSNADDSGWTWLGRATSVLAPATVRIGQS
jgi:hypothetical protein